MLFHSGRIYFPNQLDMKSKLDLILKEFQDLKLIVERLENKNKENSKDDTRDKRENTNRRRVEEDDIIHRIKIDPLTFDGILDTKILVIR